MVEGMVGLPLPRLPTTTSLMDLQGKPQDQLPTCRQTSQVSWPRPQQHLLLLAVVVGQESLLAGLPTVLVTTPRRVGATRRCRSTKTSLLCQELQLRHQ